MKTLIDEKLFAVEMSRANGGTFLAAGNYAAPALFYQRVQAKAYKDELKKHGFDKAKVVPVHMKITPR